MKRIFLSANVVMSLMNYVIDDVSLKVVDVYYAFDHRVYVSFDLDLKKIEDGVSSCVFSYLDLSQSYLHHLNVHHLL